MCTPQSPLVEAHWVKALESGQYAEARRLLEESVQAGDRAAALPLAMLYDAGIGGEKNLLRSRELLKLAASSADLSGAGKFNLGLSEIFGRGGPPDVELGSRMVRQALQEGFLPFETYNLRSLDGGRIVLAAFSETFKEINLLAGQRNPVAMTFRGIYAALGISVPPCDRASCLEIASEMVSTLKVMGETKLATAVEASLRSAHQENMSAAIGVMRYGQVVRWSANRQDQLLLSQTARMFIRPPPAQPSVSSVLSRTITKFTKFFAREVIE
jgi:hypothetical protein